MLFFRQSFDFPTILPTEYQDEIKIIINELRENDDLSLSLSYLYKLIHMLLCVGTSKQTENSRKQNIISYVHKHYRKKNQL